MNSSVLVQDQKQFADVVQDISASFDHTRITSPPIISDFGLIHKVKNNKKYTKYKSPKHASNQFTLSNNDSEKSPDKKSVIESLEEQEA